MIRVLIRSVSQYRKIKPGILCRAEHDGDAERIIRRRQLQHVSDRHDCTQRQQQGQSDRQRWSVTKHGAHAIGI